MIITKNVNIKLNVRNINRLRKYLNDSELLLGDMVNIPIDELSNGSHVRVDCVCDICGVVKNIMYQKYIKNINNGGYYSCSSACSRDKARKTTLIKYGEDHYSKTVKYKEEVKKTNNKKYGSDYYLTSKIGINTINEYNLSKYGHINVFSNSDIISKIKNTNIIKYGFDNPSKNNDIKDKISSKLKYSWDKKYKKYYLENHDIKIISYDGFNYKIECVKNHTYEIPRTLLSNRLLLNTTVCTVCNPSEISNVSGLEIEVRDFIESIYDDVVYNSKDIIYPYEIDIFIPSKRIAIEFNGLYWHSSKYKSKEYHYNKHKLCSDLDVELIQIWEDDWVYKGDIIRSIITNKIIGSDIKIGARETKIGIVNHFDANNFLIENHLKGSCKSKYNIGLYFRDELVSIMTFGSLRKSLGSDTSSNNLELHRYCNKLNVNVLGGASKILKYVRSEYEFDEIITYYDKSLGYKNLYEKVGFEFVSETPINYHYISSGIRLHRYNFRKDKLVSMGYDSNKTADEIIAEMGILKIYGPGNLKYKLSK